MPSEALADLVERLIDQLDTIEPDDLDLEAEEDCCEAGEDGGHAVSDGRTGGADDAEPDAGDEPDDVLEPARPRRNGRTTLRAERDGLVQVHRHPVRPGRCRRVIMVVQARTMQLECAR